MYVNQIMSNNFGYIDIILLAMIAGFIILRLRNILGRKTGHEDKVFSDFSDKKFENFKKQSVKSEKTNNDEILEGNNKKEFLNGANLAYESIITAFAKEDVKKLKLLLTSNMAKSFEDAIIQRKKDKMKSELTFIGIKESQLEKYEKIKNEFFATVKIVSEIISVKKNNEDKVIEGNPDKIKTVTDYWKFSKSVFSKNPNWYLSEIISK
jgi:predicted lipid-binding transport protein (Tim44 family)|tara:strand:+ start:490 stop:1116 length:627 start_codon:yes stop_codon:yes gene_type:complete